LFGTVFTWRRAGGSPADAEGTPLSAVGPQGAEGAPTPLRYSLLRYTPWRPRRPQAHRLWTTLTNRSLRTARGRRSPCCKRRTEACLATTAQSYSTRGHRTTRSGVSTQAIPKAVAGASQAPRHTQCAPPFAVIEQAPLSHGSPLAPRNPTGDPTRCLPAPARGFEHLYRLVGDQGKKNGA
jgi:hypothetical protein